MIGLYLDVIAFFLMATIIVTFNMWGVLNGGIVTLISFIFSVLMWRLVCRGLSRVFRSFVFAFFVVLFSCSIFVLVAALGVYEVVPPLYSIFAAVGLGLSTEMTAIFLAYDMFERTVFCERVGLGARALMKNFSSLPRHMQDNEDIVNAYFAAGQLSWLFANSEFKVVVIVIGGIFEELLRIIYKGNQDSPFKKAKTLGLNVVYEDAHRQQATSPFDVEFFWRNIRSKYAHSVKPQRIAPATFAVIEPSEEDARKSIGLLGAFLKSYSDYCQAID